MGEYMGHKTLTQEETATALDQLFKRVAELEKERGSGSGGGDKKMARVLRHVHDWARHIGMPAVPKTAEEKEAAKAIAGDAPPAFTKPAAYVPPLPPTPDEFVSAQSQPSADMIPSADPLSGV
jgi:hypothetical protein